MKLIVTLLLCANAALSNQKSAYESAFRSPRIIGGETARAGQFPFSAAIYKSTSDGNFFCGGALIHRQFVLTAGQCVDGAIVFTIYLGTNNLKTPDSTSVKVATDDYVLHPDFNPLTLENDIALIKLRMEIELSSYIRTIDLPFGNSISGSLEAIGWGQTSDETADLADELNYVSVYSMANSKCQETYGNQITDNMICVIGKFNEGACTGDSGSPLVMLIKGVMRKHFAIASFVSPRGCESTDPSGYTRVYPYIDWINSVING